MRIALTADAVAFSQNAQKFTLLQWHTGQALFARASMGKRPQTLQMPLQCTPRDWMSSSTEPGAVTSSRSAV
jgi:hypothetical protein